jgi:hypothetical protein
MNVKKKNIFCVIRELLLVPEWPAIERLKGLS